MTSKSQQLLTESAQRFANLLKKQGWRQKDYLSAGVVALHSSSEAERAKYRAIAAGEIPPKLKQISDLLKSMSKEEIKKAKACFNAFADEADAGSP